MAIVKTVKLTGLLVVGLIVFITWNLLFWSLLWVWFGSMWLLDMSKPQKEDTCA